MLLDSVQTLSTFPFEKIGVFLNTEVASELSARLGIRFRSNIYDYDIDTPLLKWGNYRFTQTGNTNILLSSQTLSGLFNADNTSFLVQPTNFVDVPGDFPVFFETSAVLGNNVLMNFDGGVSAITIYPSTPYPLISRLDDFKFTVSGAFFALSAFDYDLNASDFHRQLDHSTLVSLGTRNAFIQMNHHTFVGFGLVSYQMYPDAYIAGGRQDFVFSTQGNNSNSTPLVNKVIDKNIVPQTLQLGFSVASAGIPDNVYLYTMCYGNTLANGISLLSGINIEDVVVPIVKSATLDATHSKLNLVLNPGYYIPAGSDYTITYQTSTLPYVKSTVPATFKLGISGLESPNFYTLSAQAPPYLYDYKFFINYNGVKPNEEAFTITFHPEVITAQPQSSTFILSANFVDNFYQTSFPIMADEKVVRFRFTEENNDASLSAIDLQSQKIYKQSQWMPASASLLFVNDGSANSFGVSFDLSANNNSLYSIDAPRFILNKEKAYANLSINQFTNNFAVIQGIVFPDYDPNRNVIWTVDPPENIKIFQYIDETDIFVNPLDANNLYYDPPTDVIPNGQAVPANTLAIIINNLGVDKTTISMYSEEFDLITSTIWFPPSSVYNNASLVLSGNVDDMNPVRTSSISALFMKNNLLYPAPNKGSIVWKEIGNDPRGSTIFHEHGLSSIMFEDVIYPSSQLTNIVDTDISTTTATSHPQVIIFNYNANVFGNKSDEPLAKSYNLSDNLPIYVRQYPSTSNIQISLTASNGEIFDTLHQNSKFFTESDLTVTATALTSQFSSISSDSIFWSLPDGTIQNAHSVSFPLSASYCVQVSAFNARPLNTNFKFYNFTNDMCIYVLPSSYPALDYIAFPEYNLFPSLALGINEDLSYLNSVALTGLSGCTTYVTISTFGGFDTYQYQIGTKSLSSNSNVFIMPIDADDIINGGIVNVSAFNAIFPQENPLSIYNTVSSNNIDAFHESMSTVLIPSLTADFAISNQLLGLRDPNSNIFTMTLDFPFTGISVQSGTFNIILSSANGMTYSDLISFSGRYQADNFFTLNQNDLFSIKRNSYESFNLSLSGNIVKQIDGGYPCTFNQYFNSNTVTISAYDGPDIVIYTPANITTTNKVLSVFNETAIFPTGYDQFIFSDGNGHITSGYTNVSIMTASYPTEGLYTISLTAIHPIDPPTITVFPDLFTIKNSFDVYDSNINRTFPEDIILPHSSNDVRILPNSWQWENTINDSLQNLYVNYLTLSSLCFSYDINVPKSTIGWIGEKYGNITWNYETPPNIPYNTTILKNMKDFVLIGNVFAMINNNRIEFRANDYTLTLLSYTDRISAGEFLTNPTNIAYIANTNKIAILDIDKKDVYVFSLNPDYSLTFTHYWGGEGEKSSRTKLNGPVDEYYYNNILYIVDAASANIKLYNSFLNWTNQIIHPLWGDIIFPVSVTSSIEEIYVLANNGQIFVFDLNLNFIRSFDTNILGTKIYHTDSINGMLHIVSNGRIFVYTITGTYINAYQVDFPIQKMAFNNHAVYALNDFSIIKLIDYIGIRSITNASNQVMSFNAISINPDELVTDYIYNDSFIKLHNNLLSLATSITDKFVIYVDEFDQFASHDIMPILTTEKMLSASSYVPIGLNEIVSWETINRSIDNVSHDMELLRKMVDVRIARSQDTNFDWTWKSMSIDEVQSVNNNRRPFSWRELQTASTMFSPVLSGMTWKSAMNGQYESNHSPVVWVWEQMGANCIWPVTWEQMECGKRRSRTWEELANQCSITPNTTFDDCVDICS